MLPHNFEKMNPNFSDVCWHGCGRTGTLNHMLWTCPDVRTFWAAVTGFIQDLLNEEIPNQFDFCYNNCVGLWLLFQELLVLL
uniref:Uncharacterized protein n=1 Tax=Neogobius melanostomus TaxID=47308 RepID=A0A8C6WHM5_9GOBI